jgi:ribosomal protein L3 glutamine methyltransferase
MRTAADWLNHCAEKMHEAGLFFGHGTDNATDEAAWMLLHVLGAPLDGSFDDWNIELDQEQVSALEVLLARRITERKPLAYLTGLARFCGLDFNVTDDSLVPRSPIAELIVDQFFPWFSPAVNNRALDMCTGGGCLAIAMAVHMPGLVVDAVDISPRALEVASRNVELHGLSGRVNLVQSDLFASLNGRKYDLIVTNPPYVSAEVYEKLPPEYKSEPFGALVSGSDGLDIVLQLLQASPAFMSPQAVLVMEVGESAEQLQALLPAVPFLWLDFEYGGDGVFLLRYDQLVECQANVSTVLEQRKHVG